MKLECTLEQLHKLDELELGYDWTEVFKYAVNPTSLDGKASRETFIIKEVAKVFASINGQNDEHNWEMIGQLEDGRYFLISAGCDYTGWG
jgi:hypothetical protein